MDVKRKQICKEILVTAVEGGSNYWARFTNAQPHGYDYESVVLEELEAHGKEPRITNRAITLEAIERGIQMVASGVLDCHASYVGDCAVMLVRPDEADYDATTADLVMQAAVLGEIIYG